MINYILNILYSICYYIIYYTAVTIGIIITLFIVFLIISHLINYLSIYIYYVAVALITQIIVPKYQVTFSSYNILQQLYNIYKYSKCICKTLLNPLTETRCNLYDLYTSKWISFVSEDFDYNFIRQCYTDTYGEDIDLLTIQD